MPYDRLNPVYLHRLWPDQARWRAGLIQLFCMSTCLWTFGKYLERVLLLPTLAVPAVYMVSGVAGGLASANLAVDRVTVTCTAAICGLVGGGSLHICNALSYCSHFWPCRSCSFVCMCGVRPHCISQSADLPVGARFTGSPLTSCTGYTLL